MKQKEIKSKSVAGKLDTTETPPGAHILKRRRVDLFRLTAIVVVAGLGLIFLMNWYRAWPQDIDCQRMNQRVATAIENYRTVHRKLPQILSFLEIRKGRYSVDHYEYWFEGLGGPAVLPEGTLVAYCKNPHAPMFSKPWRNVIIFMNGSVIEGRVTESEFKTMIAKQLAPERYWSLPKSFAGH